MPSLSATVPPELADVQAYLDAVKPIAAEGGRIVQQGMKHAVAELQKPDGDHEEQARLAPGWVESMTSLRDEWAAVEPPAELVTAHALFLAAWEAYLQVAQTLVVASTDADQRETLTDEAIARGEAGDDRWDEAAALVQALYRDHGAYPVAWLPGE